jgi:hypothetical protein
MDKTINGFQGIDTRRLRESADPRTARWAKNVDLTLGREFVARDPLVEVQALDPRSVGLYSIGGTLRSAVPGGQGVALEDTGAVRVKYDHLGVVGGSFSALACYPSPGGTDVDLIGGTWPTNVDSTFVLVIENDDATTTAHQIVSRVSGTRVTIATPWLGPTAIPRKFALYPTTEGTCLRHTDFVANSTTITLTGGETWPSDFALPAYAPHGSYGPDVIEAITSPSTARLTGPYRFPTAPAYARYYYRIYGAVALQSLFVRLTNGSNVATLVGSGSFPEDLRAASFSTYDGQFSSAVSDRVSSTEIRLATAFAGVTGDYAFLVSGLAIAYPLDTLVGIGAAESVGARASFGVYPYLAVERWRDAADPSLGTIFEHHWITNDAASETSAPATQVSLPFSPGRSLLKAAGKVFAPDDVNGVVRYCSTENGPTDWTTPNDAGYIPVLTHASGDRRIQGLGTYDDKMAVIFLDAVQLWQTDPDPENISLARVIDGPGTESHNSVVNVLGDLFYFTAGGFRSLHMQTVTGQIQEQDDIGAPVASLTAAEDGALAVALWSQKRGQYLCAFGNRVYAFKYSPKSKVMGWTTWELQVPVEYAVEHQGTLFIRSGNTLYKFDPAATSDVAFDVAFNDFVGKIPRARKRLDFIEVIQRGTSVVQAFLEATSDEKYLEGPSLAGTTADKDRVFMGGLARSYGFRFTGTGPWTLSEFSVSFTQLPW